MAFPTSSTLVLVFHCFLAGPGLAWFCDGLMAEGCCRCGIANKPTLGPLRCVILLVLLSYVGRLACYLSLR